MANLPILGKRRERKAAAMQAAIDAAVEDRVGKALSPAQAGAPPAMGVPGATYPIPNPSSPFTQTSGMVGANPLPREFNTFGSLFGPGYPLFPDALDILRPDGRADPRRYQYPVTWNLQLIDREVPWSLLRKIASEVDVVARCIQLVQDAVAGMQWHWGFSPAIIDQIQRDNKEPNRAKATLIARDKFGADLDRVQKFFQRPDERMSYTFSQWLTLMVGNQLTYDGIVIYPMRNLKGDIHSLSILDTSSIKILLDSWGFLPEPPAPAYQQILYGFPRTEFQAEPAADGTVPNGFQRDQLSYYIRRPRSHTPYGFSTVEECINYATLYQERQAWMHAEWSHGVTPKLVIETTGTNWSPEQLGYAQQVINDEWSGQTQRRQQAMILRDGMKATQLKDMAELYNSEMDQWLVMQIGAKFGVPQTQLGIPLALHNLSGQNTVQMDLTDKFSLDALVNFLVDSINDLARRYLGIGPEITIIASGANTDAADLATAQADASDVNNGIKTRNEVRAERGIALIAEPEADMLGITTATGVTFLPGQLDLQEAQLQLVEEQAALPAGPDARQRSSGKDERAAPDVKPTATRPLREKDTKHKARTPGKSAPSTKVPDAALARGADRGSYYVKELSAFANFAKARIGRTWRDFEFTAVDPAYGATLNALASQGDIAAAVKAAAPVAAGILVRSKKTGRVLLVQRDIENSSASRGLFEVPGGKLDGRESPWEAAQREWEEELGQDLPKGKQTGSWATPTGHYVGFVYEVKNEDAVDLSDVRSTDEVENAAWFDPQDLRQNPITRLETDSIDWSLLTGAKKALLAPTDSDGDRQIAALSEATSQLSKTLERFAAQKPPEIHVHNETPGYQLPDMHFAITTPEQPAAQVQVMSPDVHVAPAEVNVHVDAPDLSKAKAPVVNITAPEISIPPGQVIVNVPEQPPAQITVESPTVHVDAPVTVRVPKQPPPPAPIVNVEPHIEVAVPEPPAPPGNIRARSFKRSDGSTDFEIERRD